MSPVAPTSIWLEATPNWAVAVVDTVGMSDANLFRFKLRSIEDETIAKSDGLLDVKFSL